jgi:hypothetical protein
VLPYVAVAAGVGAVVVLLAVATRRRPGMAGIVPAGAVLCVLGLSLSRQVHVVEEMTQPPDPFVPPHARGVMVGPGGFRAAAWLRDHSGVDDLVATNAHQRTPRGGDNRAFWIAAESERHVLVEGWGYSPPVLSGSRATGVSDTHAGFWDPALLAENDAAFTDPSNATVTRLARAEGVRWLFVDARFPSRPRAMGQVADLRFRSGDYWIFEVRGA